MGTAFKIGYRDFMYKYYYYNKNFEKLISEFNTIQTIKVK